MGSAATEPSRWQQRLDRLRFRLRDRLIKTVRVEDGEYVHTFRCGTPVEVWRAITLMVKEEGTVRWIRSAVKAGDVFYDIGANIGLYTLVAGRRIGPEGRAYAFEPHVANAHSLLRNVSANGLNARVTVLSCALNDRPGFFDFGYASDDPGSAMSQLGNTGARGGDGDQPFQPIYSECKYATTVDELVGAGVIRPADHIKIDVDGNELLVLKGMRNLLGGENPPRSVQVEINVGYKAEICALMEAFGYTLAERHDTLPGRRKIAAGQDPESFGYQVVFTRKDSSRGASSS